MASRRLAAPVGSAAAPAGPAAVSPPLPSRVSNAESTPEFPGCRPVRITRDAIADHESRIDYWDAATETAWVACEPNTVYHEGPGQVLNGLLTRIAAIRGAPILTLGAADLLLRNARGERQRILQADQVVFLEPVETRPRGAAVEVGSDHLPDVVLEVDYATDVRRGKLGLYEAWGFLEVWVEVPEGGSPRRRPGLTIHRRGPDGYRSVEASVALPGWTAVEIHAAFNEAELSEATCAVLERVGRALGEARGTGPDDDSLAGSAAPRSACGRVHGDRARDPAESRAGRLGTTGRTSRGGGSECAGCRRTGLPRRGGPAGPPERAAGHRPAGAHARPLREARRSLHRFPCNGTRPLPRVRAW